MKSVENNNKEDLIKKIVYCGQNTGFKIYPTEILLKKYENGQESPLIGFTDISKKERKKILDTIVKIVLDFSEKIEGISVKKNAIKIMRETDDPRDLKSMYIYLETKKGEEKNVQLLNAIIRKKIIAISKAEKTSDIEIHENLIMKEISLTNKEETILTAISESKEKEPSKCIFEKINKIIRKELERNNIKVKRTHCKNTTKKTPIIKSISTTQDLSKTFQVQM